MIVSYTNSRVRLRHPDFKDPSLSLDGLRAVKGVSKVDHNPRTGSVLVLFDQESLDPEGAMAALGELDPEALRALQEFAEGQAEAAEAAEGAPPQAGHQDARDKTLTETVCLVVALLSVVASGFLNRKKLHVFVGLYLLEMIGGHLWRFRHRLKGNFDLLGFLGIRRAPAKKGQGGDGPQPAALLEKAPGEAPGEAPEKAPGEAPDEE
jgi:hypothetical protein